MACDARGNTAGPEGAADVDIEARLQLQPTELPDSDPVMTFGFQHHGVGAGLRVKPVE